MVQSTLQALQNASLEVLGWLLPAGSLLLIILGVLLVAGLVLYAVDRDGFRRARDWLVSRTARAAVWLPVAFGLLAAAFALTLVRQSVLERFVNQSSARYSNQEDPAGGQTVQYSPTVSYAEETTYDRSITIPGFLASRLGTLEAAQLIAPYLVDPQSENIKKLEDQFRRSGRDLVFTRRAVVNTLKPVALDNAEVNVDFSFGDTGAGRSFYRADFSAKYTYQNPNDAPTSTRFTFPLPEQSGTLADFAVTLNGQPVKQPDLTGGFLFETTLAAKAKAEVVVKYKNQGSGTWSYDFGYRREPIRNFKLTVNSGRPVKFLRGSLYPTERSPASLTWQLRDVITSQGVVVQFPERSLRETMTKVFSFAPAALVLLCAWVLAWAWRRGLALEPSRVVLAVVGVGLGLGVAGILLGYVAPGVAAWVGAILGAVLGVAALGPLYALPVVLSSLTPLAFLSVGNAGLLLALVAVIAVGSVLRFEELRALVRRRTG